jgi:hypothetical protein
MFVSSTLALLAVGKLPSFSGAYSRLRFDAARVPNPPVAQVACEKRLDNVFELPSEKTDHSNAGSDKRFFQRQRNGSAEQHVHSQFGQLLDTLEGASTGQPQGLSVDLPAAFDVQQQQMVRHIEDR